MLLDGNYHFTTFLALSHSNVQQNIGKNCCHVVVFWNMTPCSLVGGYQTLEEPATSILRLEDEGSKIFRTVNKHVRYYIANLQ